MMPRPSLFRLGRIVSTPGALAAFDRNHGRGDGMWELLWRHICGDWGTVSEDDARENELSVREGFRILSSYELADGTRIWIITERDRSVTTALLPEEY